MNITDIITITELSRLTGKSRPTLYKYISDWECGAYNDIPYLFIQLFSKIRTGDFRRSEVISYCSTEFQKCKGDDSELDEFVAFIKNNRSKIDLKKWRCAIEEDINNG